MAILKVSRMGHPVLRHKAREIPPDQIQSLPVQQLIDAMIETMEDYEGIGLAAPQVFQSLRLIVLGRTGADSESPDAIPLKIFINPEWLDLSEEQEDDWEGCLSIPDIRGVVPRSASVGMRAFDRQGRRFELQVSGLFARVLQHEVDHLDGILFLDRMEDMRTLTFLEEYYRHWCDPEQ